MAVCKLFSCFLETLIKACPFPPLSVLASVCLVVPLSQTVVADRTVSHPDVDSQVWLDQTLPSSTGGLLSAFGQLSGTSFHCIESLSSFVGTIAT
jgi:hypothetical protein